MSLLLATNDDLREKHRDDHKRKLITPIPGTSYSVEVWTFGSYSERRRIYGFNSDNKTVVVIEAHDDRPEIGSILAKCRNTQPWHWFMKDKWYPVGSYPPETDDYTPPKYSKLFQNGNGIGGNAGHIPNAWARTKSNGNKVIVWDVLWDENIDGIGPGILNAQDRNISPGRALDLKFAIIEAMLEMSEEPDIDPGVPDPFSQG